jgi:hypothetical protein
MRTVTHTARTSPLAPICHAVALIGRPGLKGPTSIERLPIVPRAWPDELLSSWVERIWLFYGGTYELGIGAVLSHVSRSPLDQTIDIDSDPTVHDYVRGWTGVGCDYVPKLLSEETDRLLPPAARLAYGPACWDTDVASGGAPHVRRHSKEKVPRRRSIRTCRGAQSVSNPSFETGTFDAECTPRPSCPILACKSFGSVPQCRVAPPPC